MSSSSLATLVCAIGVLGLFYLDRDKSLRTSKALWIPVIWLWINGSRSVSVWLGITSTSNSASNLLQGNPIDRSVLGSLMALGLIALIPRRGRIIPLLKQSWPILLYLSFCLVSVLWSDFPRVAFRRWTKGIGDLVMVLIVLTDPRPKAALERLITRVGFVLMPASVLLIKYYPDLGRYHERSYAGNRGVSTDKNMLGVIVFVLSVGAFWLVLRLLRDSSQPNRARHFLAQGTLLAFGVSLFFMAHSATSAACFVLGAGLMLAAGWSVIGRRTAAVHALVFAVLLTGTLTIFLGGYPYVVHAMGRQTSLHDRTTIWHTLIPLATNPVVGAGYESFWLGPRLETMWSAFPGSYLTEAHNGYLETYLNLGWVGVGLIALILIHGYRRAVRTFATDPTYGALLLAYVLTAAVYSITEAGFRQLGPVWIFLLLAIVAASDSSGRLEAAQGDQISGSLVELDVALLTGGQDRPYAFGMATAMAAQGISMEIVGNDLVDSPEFHTTPKLKFLNLGGIQQSEASFPTKLLQLCGYYARLIRYVTLAKPRLLHILWNNKFESFDRTLLMLYYKLSGKKVALTAHNVNRDKRDSSDSPIKHLTLKIQYRLVDHIFVHTDEMKSELREDFGVRAQAVTVIPFGINNVTEDTDLTPAEAKRRLSIGDEERTILFFGRIVPYKGLEYLLSAFKEILARDPTYRLIIAGAPMKSCEKYCRQIQQTVNGTDIRDRIVGKFEFIPDEDTELYFKAADALVLPYKSISQSGVLFLAYRFGTPVIAANVGSFKQDIIDGRTGFLYRSGDAADLARVIEIYFESDLYKELDRRRQEIKDFMQARHSWDLVGKLTRDVYEGLLQK
jgi:glycosyltransferase involved in cell wall biosynthesis/O-antigen ligase